MASRSSPGGSATVTTVLSDGIDLIGLWPESLSEGCTIAFVTDQPRNRGAVARWGGPHLRLRSRGGYRFAFASFGAQDVAANRGEFFPVSDHGADAVLSFDPMGPGGGSAVAMLANLGSSVTRVALRL